MSEETISPCPQWYDCPICASAGRCMKYQSQSNPLTGSPHYNRESLHCPETGQHCYDPLCRKDFCLRKDRRDKRDSEELWEEMMKKFDAMPTYFSHDLTGTVKKLVDIIDRLTRNTEHKKERPIFVLTTIINHQNLILMADVQLVVGSPKTGIFTLIDNKTLLPITSASFSNQAVGFNSNPEFATFALDTANPNNLIGTPIAAGSGTVMITTNASWTDAGDNSSQTGSFSVIKNFTVIASQDGASFDIIFL